MNTLQEQLDRLIKRKGEQDPLVQMLRNQIMAEQSGKNFQELYLTGSVSTPERFRTIDPNSTAAKIAQELCDSLNATVLKREKERNKTKSQEE
jgi:hypothetical protein